MSETPIPPPPPPAPPLQPVPAPPKKGIPTVGWLGIGCGTILLIGVIVISLAVGFCRRQMNDLRNDREALTARLMHIEEPNVVIMKSDDLTGAITIRTDDGYETTLSYEEIREGNSRVVDSNGNLMGTASADWSMVPDWVPHVPEAEGLVHIYGDGKSGFSGAYTTKTAASPESIEAFFKSEADRLGFNSSSLSSTEINGALNRISRFRGNQRELTLTLTKSGGKPLMAGVNYFEKK